jgi:hypothetical protein
MSRKKDRAKVNPSRPQVLDGEGVALLLELLTGGADDLRARAQMIRVVAQNLELVLPKLGSNLDDKRRLLLGVERELTATANAVRGAIRVSGESPVAVFNLKEWSEATRAHAKWLATRDCAASVLAQVIKAAGMPPAAGQA